MPNRVLPPQATPSTRTVPPAHDGTTAKANATGNTTLVLYADGVIFDTTAGVAVKPEETNIAKHI